MAKLNLYLGFSNTIYFRVTELQADYSGERDFDLYIKYGTKNIMLANEERLKYKTGDKSQSILYGYRDDTGEKIPFGESISIMMIIYYNGGQTSITSTQKLYSNIYNVEDWLQSIFIGQIGFTKFQLDLDTSYQDYITVENTKYYLKSYSSVKNLDSNKVILENISLPTNSIETYGELNENTEYELFFGVEFDLDDRDFFDSITYLSDFKTQWYYEYDSIKTFNTLPFLEVKTVKTGITDITIELKQPDDLMSGYYNSVNWYIGTSLSSISFYESSNIDDMIEFTELNSNTTYYIQYRIYSKISNDYTDSSTIVRNTLPKPELEVISVTTDSITAQIINIGTYKEIYWYIGNNNYIHGITSPNDLGYTYTYTGIDPGTYRIKAKIFYENNDSYTTNSVSVTILPKQQISLFNWGDYNYYDNIEHKYVEQPVPETGVTFVLSAEAWNGLIDKINEILEIKNQDSSDLIEVIPKDPITAEAYNALGKEIVSLSRDYDKKPSHSGYYNEFINNGQVSKNSPIYANRLKWLVEVLNQTIDYINTNG